MHFEFALDSPDIDLWNIDLVDTYLDLRYKVVPVNILFVSKTSSRRLQDGFKTCLQDVFKTFNVTIFLLPRRLQDVLEDEKLLRWKSVEGFFKTYLEDASSRHILKTNKCLLGSIINPVFPYSTLDARMKMHWQRQFSVIV